MCSDVAIMFVVPCFFYLRLYINQDDNRNSASLYCIIIWYLSILYRSEALPVGLRMTPGEEAGFKKG